MGVLINGMLEVCVYIVVSVNDRRRYVRVIQVYMGALIIGKNGIL